MPEEKIGEKRIGILWDIQNTVVTALRDLESTGVDVHTILIAAASCIEEETSRLGACVLRLGAFSLPLSQPETYDKRFWRWIESTADLWRIGYILFLSPEEKNAADYDITQNSLDLLQSKNVSACILVTGDGQKPFPEFVSRITNAGIETHVLSYDYVPPSFKNGSAVRTTIIASAIKEFLIGIHEEKKQNGGRLRRRNPRGSPAPRILLSKDRHTIIEAVRYAAGAGIKHTKDIEAWQPYVRRSVSAIRSPVHPHEKTTPREAKFSIWKEILITEFKEEKGISHKEVEILLNALIEYTDCFEKTNLYILNPHSRLFPKPEEKPLS